MKATFESLLESIGQGDIDRLQAQKAGLVAERAKLQDKLAKMNKERHEVEMQLVSPLRNAILAAELLNIEVPEQYRTLKAGLANGSRSQGKFDWSGKGFMPFKAEVSRAMWRLSQGSGGSAGKKGEGALSAVECWALVKIDEAAVKVGEKHTVTLPNGKEVTFQKVE